MTPDPLAPEDLHHHNCRSHNLRASPDEVVIQDGAERFPVRVRELRGEERALWWERAVAAYPPYADYQAATDRAIPVFVARRRA